MLHRILRSLLATMLLVGVSVGIFGINVALGLNPLTGGGSATVSFVSGIASQSVSTLSKSSKEYSRAFPITDGSKVSVTLRGIRVSDSLLDFRLRGRALVSYNDGISAGDVSSGSTAYHDSSHQADDVRLEKASVSGKDALCSGVRSGLAVEAAPTADVQKYPSQVVSLLSNPHVGGSQAPPENISLTIA